MEVDQTICKHCNETIGNDTIEYDYFETLANQLEDARESYLLPNQRHNLVLDKTQIIKWLLTNATEKKLDSSEIDDITDQCLCVNQSDVINILKYHGVNIEVPKSLYNWDISKVSEITDYALYYATKLGTSEIITFILSFQINNHIPENVFDLLLHTAVTNNNLLTIIKLIELGANVYSKNNEKLNVLESSTLNSSYHIVEWLVNNEYNENDASCITALIIAIENKKYDIVKLLIDFSNLYLKDSSSIILAAAQIGNIDLIKYLERNGCSLLAKEYDDYSSIVHSAAKYGHLNLLKWLKSRGLNLNVLLLNNESPLHEAALKGHLECVKYLVHNNCDVNIANNHGYSILSSAFYGKNTKNIEIIKFLVAHGANPLSMIDSFFRTLFHALRGKETYGNRSLIDLIKFLSPFDIDVSSKDVNALLIFAIEVLDWEAVQWLLDKGVDINDVLELTTLMVGTCEEKNDWKMISLCIDYMKDINQLIDGETLLQKVASSSEAVKILIEKNADVNKISTLDGSSPLIASLTNILSSDAANMLLDNDADVNVITVHGNTALQIALSNNHNIHIIKRLIEKGVDINIINTVDHSSSLIRALKNYDTDDRIIELLLDNGANVNIKTYHGFTALYYAIINYKDIHLIKKLINLGANVNVNKNLKKNVILHAAVLRGDLEIIQCLVEAGADVNSLCKFDTKLHSPLTLPCYYSNNKWEIVKYLIENGSDVNYYANGRPVLYDAIVSGDVELVSYLLSHGARTDIIIPNEVSILHNCTSITNKNNKLEILKLLINHGANINGSNLKGETILFTNINNINIIDYLLRMGINVNKDNIEGGTVLHHVLYEQYIVNKLSIVMKLINYGANINHVDEKGNTPLLIAVSDPNCSDIAQILVQKGANLKAFNAIGNSILHETSLGELGMWLIGKGADVNAKNNLDVTVLQFAIQKISKDNVCTTNIVKTLINRSMTNETISNNTITTIHRLRYMEYVHLLINKVQTVSTLNDLQMTPLHDAIFIDNVSIFDHLCQKGINILTELGNGNTALHLAVVLGSMNIIRYLLNDIKDGLLFEENFANDTPLHIAVKLNNVNIVKLLLEHTFNINHKNIEQKTALQIACINNNIDIVKLLVSKGANLNDDNVEDTPLIIALYNSHFELFKYLINIEKHKLIEQKYNFNDSLLHAAIMSGSTDDIFVKYIVENNIIPLNIVDMFGGTPLHSACSINDLKYIRLLVNNGADVNLIDNNGNTPMHVAAVFCDREVMRFLIKNGGNLYIKNNKGNTVIHIAAVRGFDTIDDIIISSIEDLYIKNRKGNTPLHIAAVSSKHKAFSRLIKTYPSINLSVVNCKKQTPLQLLLLSRHEYKKNALLCIDKESVNNQDIIGNTALHIAIFNKNCEEISYKLIKNGADLSIKNKCDDPPLYLAMMEYQNGTIKNLLPYVTDVYISEKFGIDIMAFAINNLDLEFLELLFEMVDINSKTILNETCLHITLNNEHLSKFIWLISHCSSIINEKEKVLGHTVLHKCVMSGYDTKIIELLIRHGADINIVDNNKNSILHMAVLERKNELIEILIKHNIKLYLCNIEMETALHIAVKSKYIYAIRMLCNRGINVNAVNIDGETALHLAVKAKSLSCVVYLIRHAKCNYNIVNNHGLTAYTLAMLMDNNKKIVKWFAKLSSELLY